MPSLVIARTHSHYLDWNASAPVLPEVREVVYAMLAEAGNPSSIHRFGRIARSRMEDAREAVAALAGGASGGVKAAQVTFTSGGTEALMIALHGLCNDPKAEIQPRRYLVSAVEHPAVAAAAHACAGQAPLILPVTAQGLLDLSVLQEALGQCQSQGLQPIVAVQVANNETGILQDLPPVVEKVHQAGGLVVCDGVQAAGKVVLSLRDLGVDALALSAHKIGGLQGCGALILRQGRGLRPLMAGGGQERGLRGGTQNGPGIVGFGVAARHAVADLAAGVGGQMAALRDSLQDRMVALAPSAHVYGGTVARLPNTLSVGLPGVDQQRQVMALDLAGVAVSAGSACSSGKIAPSAVLMAMGASESEARQTIRISLGPTTNEQDLQAFLKAWEPMTKAMVPASAG